MENKDLLDRIKKIENEINLLKNYSTIPRDIGDAIKARVLPNNFVVGRQGTGVPSTVSINEAGSSIIEAQAPLSGKLELTIEGNVYVIPTI